MFKLNDPDYPMLHIIAIHIVLDSGAMLQRCTAVSQHKATESPDLFVN